MKLIIGAFFSCLLLLLSAPGFDMGSLGWFAWVPFLYVLKNEKLTLRHTVLVFFMFAFLSSFAVLFWVRHVAYLGLFLLSFYFSLMFALSALAVFYLSRKTTVSFALVFAVVFTSFEYLRGVLFTGFPWFLMGWTQYDFPHMIQIASVTGVYGVSFVILLVNGLLCEFFIRIGEKGRNKYVLLILSLLLAGGNYFYGMYSLDKHDKKNDTGVFKIFAVQGNVFPSLIWDPVYSREKFNKYADLTSDNYSDDCDMIVWPEGAIDGEIRYHDDNFQFVKDTAVAKNKPFLLQSNDVIFGENSSYYNAAFLFSEEGKLKDVYYKIHLVPFGEYTPFRKYISFLSKFVPIPENFTAGKEVKLFDFSMGEVKIKAAPLVCFEDVFPSHVRQFMKSGADIMINVTNDGWFKKSFAPFQHMALSLFRAVEHNRPMIRVANTGISCAVDGAGRIVSRLTDSEGKSLCRDAAGILKVRLKQDSGITFYTRFGDVFAFSMMFIFFIFAILAFKSKKDLEI